jgi:hypothetical protein
MAEGQQAQSGEQPKLRQAVPTGHPKQAHRLLHTARKPKVKLLICGRAGRSGVRHMRRGKHADQSQAAAGRHNPSRLDHQFEMQNKQLQ